MTEKQGRLVKKDAVKDMSYLDVQEYPWQGFVEDDILFTDNPRRSVVHSRFHTEDELERKVRVPQNFARQMGPKARTLIPTDLTEEYARSQQEIFLRKRKRMLDEDELFNLELADLNGQTSDLDGAWSKRSTPEPPEAKAEARSEFRPLAKAEETSVSVPAAPHAAQPSQETSASLAATRARAEEEGFATGHALGLAQALAQGRAQEIENAASTFTSTSTSAAADESEGHSQGLLRGLAEGLSQGRTEGHADGIESGYEQGFADGESKGIAAAEARTERYFSLLAQALSELETLRGEVLRAGQDIFIEIANLCAEKILRQKLGASDQALRTVLLSAIEMYADAHRVTLDMNPADAARMKSALADLSSTDGGPRVTVRENPDLAEGDFRAESDKEILTVDLKRAVEGLIVGLRAELFPSEVPSVASGAPGDASHDGQSSSPSRKSG